MKIKPRIFLYIITALVSILGTVRGYAQLNADASNSTIFMIGYEIWWNPSGPSFNPAATSANIRYNSTTVQSLAIQEHSIFVNGQDPSAYLPMETIEAIPSLNATIQTPSGPATFTATPGPNFSPGYDSINDSAIAYHAHLISNLGISVIVPDMTNDMASNFPTQVTYSVEESNSTAAPWSYQRSFAHLLADLDSPGMPSLYVVPAIGAQNAPDVHIDPQHNPDVYSPFQRALMFMIDALKAHPGRAVIYQGKPLIVVYHGVGTEVPNLITTTDSQAHVFLDNPNSPYNNFTLRHMGGLMESQSSLWADSNNPQSLHPPYTQARDGLWSWIERVYSYGNDAFSSYSLVPSGQIGAGDVEFSVIVPASWSDPSTPFLTHRSGEQINFHMSKARTLHPKFALVNQFNAFMNDLNSGFTMDSQLNLEPTVDSNGTIHHELFDEMQAAIASYRTYEQGQGTARFVDMSLRGQVANGTSGTLLFDFVLGGEGTPVPQRLVFKGMGPSLSGFPYIAPESVTFAANPMFTLDSLSGNGFHAVNSSYSVPASATIYGLAAISALGPRTFRNSTRYVNDLNYGRTMTNAEPAITADLDPGIYQLAVGDINDPNFNGGSPSPGPMAHMRLIPTDTISPNRITSFSARGYVSSGDKVIILGVTVDKTKNVLISALGPTLANSPYNLSPALAQPTVALYDGDKTFVQGWTGEGAWAVTLAGNVNYTVILSNVNTSGSGDGIGWLSIGEN